MGLYDVIFLILGLYHNAMLIALFYASKRQANKQLTTIGKWYLAVMLPGSVGITIWAAILGFRWGYMLLLLILIIYLLIEILYDYVLKVNWRNNWRFAAPYLAFYYIANYAVVVLNWEYSITWGIILLILFILQIITNIWSHPRAKAVESTVST